MHSRKKWIIVISLLAAVVAAGDTVARKPIKEFYNSHQLAFFADTTSVEFVRPGLTITVNSASIASNGAITTTFTLTDPSGLPLDEAGVTTPGTISLSFLAATIPQGQEQYSSYITKAATGKVIASVNQPAADSGGTTAQVGPGQYTYTYKALATGFDPTATSTVGIYGSRNLTAYSLGTDYASTTFNFVPNGSKVVTTRDVIRDVSCNACHDQLSAHGGSRRGMAICVMCHQPQNIDPNTGNLLDMKVMAHKIHMGSSLPSVIAGTPYQIIGYQNSVNDFSAVVDPASAQRCFVCHSQTSGAAQATAYMTNPTRVTCGSCHDNVNFATGANHPAGPEPNDSQCSTCHVPQGATDFDASIVGAHVVTTDSSLLSGLNATITNVVGGTAGNKPTVTFTLTNKAGQGVPISALGSLSLTMAGPTTDYGYTAFGTATTPGYVTESVTAAAASCSAAGTCQYTFTHTVPAGATGTFAIGLEARRTETVLAGYPNQQSIEYGAFNPVYYFSVDGSTVAPRRTVVVESNCNACHYALSEHGTLRSNVAYCVMCHNPSNTDVSTRPSATVAAQQTMPNQGINFNMLVHRIHFGPNATADGAKNPYIVVGYGGSINNFSTTLFPPLSPTGTPGDTENCSMCHTNSSEQTLPLGKNPVVDPQGWINPNQAIAGACSGCHTSEAEASHFLGNTTSLGEACTVCHSSGAAYAVDAVHAQY